MWLRKQPTHEIKSIEEKIRILEEANKSSRESLVEALLELKRKLGCAKMDEGLAQMEFKPKDGE